MLKLTLADSGEGGPKNILTFTDRGGGGAQWVKIKVHSTLVLNVKRNKIMLCISFFGGLCLVSSDYAKVWKT